MIERERHQIEIAIIVLIARTENSQYHCHVSHILRTALYFVAHLDLFATYISSVVCCRTDNKDRRSASSKSKSKSLKEGSTADSKDRDKKDAKGDDKAEDEAFDPTNLDKVSL